MKELKERARQLLREFKGDSYIFGVDCLQRIGGLVSPFGEKCLPITNLGERSKDDLERITTCFSREKLEVIGPLPSTRTNVLREDVARLPRESSLNLLMILFLKCLRSG